MKYIVINGRLYTLENVQEIYEKADNPHCTSSSDIYLIIRYTNQSESRAHCGYGLDGVKNYNQILENICKILDGEK